MFTYVRAYFRVSRGRNGRAQPVFLRVPGSRKLYSRVSRLLCGSVRCAATGHELRTAFTAALSSAVSSSFVFSRVPHGSRLPGRALCHFASPGLPGRAVLSLPGTRENTPLVYAGRL